MVNKKIITLFGVICVVILIYNLTLTKNVIASERTIQIQVHDSILYIPETEVQPFIKNGQPILPIRLIMESAGVGVWWNEEDQSVRFSTPYIFSYITIGSHEMYIVHGDRVQLDVAPQLINGRTMVSMDVITYATSLEANWDVENYIVSITRRRLFEVVQRPVIRPDYWPEHLPYHVPGSIHLLEEDSFQHLLTEHLFPLQFRAEFYRMHGIFSDLVTSEQRDEKDRYVWGYHGVISGETMVLMRFVQVHNISREEFDAVLEEYTARLSANDEFFGMVRRNDEFNELPNADIIFTFDNEIIRYFYRRE